MRKPKNIIFIVVDSLRHDSIYQNGDLGLDYLEKNAIQFQQARSGGCWTLPSTASMFTGLMPHQHQATSQTRQLPRHIPTLSEKLKSAGYQPIQITGNMVTTDIFGLDRGFDHTYKIWNHIEPRLTKLIRFIMLLSRPRIRKEIMAGSIILSNVNQYLDAGNVWAQTTHQDIYRMARQILKQNEARNQGSFLFLNVMECHFPYHIDETFKPSSSNPAKNIQEIIGLYSQLNQTFLKKERDLILKKTGKVLRNRQQRAWRHIRQNLDAFIREMHEDKDNLVVFCADHGENFGDQNWFYHFSNVTDAGNRVPLFWLGHNHPAPQTITRPASLTGVHNAILQACGLETNDGGILDDRPETTPIMQSYWYNSQGKTLDKYKFNQFCFLEDNQRYLLRNTEWYAAPVNGTDPESLFKPMPQDANPVEDKVADRGKRNFLRQSIKEFRTFSEPLLKPE